MPDVPVNEHFVQTNGVTLRVLEAGAGPAVLLAHGFPELAYSWRHQIQPLAAAGYRVIVPDQRGYGGSSIPAEITDYDIVHLTDDLAGVLDALGESECTIVGHDWGSFVASHFAQMKPDYTRALVNMSVPHMPRGPVSVVAGLRMAIPEDQFFYILYFQDVGPADEELARDPRKTMTRMLLGVKMNSESSGALLDPEFNKKDERGFVDRLPEPPAELPDWITQEEIDVYVDSFAKTGFTGGINWYRNFHRNWEITTELDGKKIEVPSYFIAGAQDPVIAMGGPGVGHHALSDHRGDLLIDDAGHWVQQEKPAETNAGLLQFLNSVYGQ